VRGRQARRRGSGAEEPGIGRGIELREPRMAPAPVDDVEQAVARADRGEHLIAVSCGTPVMATVMLALW
jgi:hypothetical protein